MGIYLRNKIYWYKRRIEGAQYYRSLRIKKGQEHLLSARMAQMDERIVADHYGLPSRYAGRDMLFGEFIPIYEKRKVGKGSLDRDIQRLNIALGILGDKRLAHYTMDDFQRLEKRLLEDKLETSTVNRYFQCLHHFYDIALREKAVLQNPLNDYEYFVEDAQRRRALTDDEIKTLLASLRTFRDEAISGPRKKPVQAILYDMVLFGLYTGARLNEIVGLKRKEIDGDVIRLKISRVKFRKRGRQATSREKPIFLPPEALKIIARQPVRDEYVFPLRRRDPRVISKAIHQLQEKDRLGIRGFTFHCLRHTWVSRATELTDTATVRSMAGHSDYRTTLRYTHTDEPKKRAVIARLGTQLAALVVND
jgi:integrase